MYLNGVRRVHFACVLKSVVTGSARQVFDVTDELVFHLNPITRRVDSCTTGVKTTILL